LLIILLKLLIVRLEEIFNMYKLKTKDVDLDKKNLDEFQAKEVSGK
jgi:hypothetical protein